MTSTTPQPEDFQRQVLERLDKIDSDIQRTNNRLDNLFNGLVTALVSTVIAASLLILARNGIELWLQLK
ncbi:hypothetical protein [Acaryochloris marina]|uniref:hypothetical protein n=1 Tax=Acaryochloris marina TaxID=155978 RepID=UPI00059F54F6|nr:hypothetical protein [Acaryochloris marina]BDM83211.1 hypothetical protein AM10699_60720 [Acaryochloris marina MBIC10699]